MKDKFHSYRAKYRSGGKKQGIVSPIKGKRREKRKRKHSSTIQESDLVKQVRNYNLLYDNVELLLQRRKK